jgi:hypothetical protein
VKKHTVIVLLFLLANCFLYASNHKIKDNFAVNKKRIYKVDMCDLPLKIELIENSNGSFEGEIIMTLDKVTKSGDKEITKKLSIDSKIVEKLMLETEKIGIEKIKDCNENKDCVEGLDGSYTTFAIKNQKLEREYSFWELIPNTNTDKVVPVNRKQAQEILNLLDKHLNLDKSFSLMLKLLPKGEYSYYYGATNAIASFTIK